MGMTDQDLDLISRAIENERKTEAYPIKFEVDQLKENFALLVIKLEDAMNPAKTASEEVQETISHHRKISFGDFIKNVFHSPALRLAPAVAMATVGLATAVARETFQ